MEHNFEVTFTFQLFNHAQSYIFLQMYFEWWNLQLSLQSWNDDVSESFVVKRHADNAFRSKDYSTAIECYSRVCLYYHVMLTNNSPSYICTYLFVIFQNVTFAISLYSSRF
jgi:hypothetical protein